MSFANPVVLWGLLGPLLGALTLAILAVLRRHRAWTRWPGITRVVAIGTHVHAVSVGRGTRRPWLLLFALALALIALARPRWGVIEEPVYQKSREVMIALDLSRSMLVQDVLPSRLERSRLLVRSLLDGLRGERVGLIVFAGTAFVQVPMSTDYQILEEFLPELKPETMPQGGSDYDGMLRAALGGFSTSDSADRYLIVLSDGEAQDEAWRKQLPPIKEKGIHAIALGVGTTAGGFIPDARTGAYLKDQRGAVVLSKLEPATLQALAFETAGAYRDASAWVDLAALLQETIERGRQGTFGDKREARAIERFQWFLLPALIFALLGVWREIPVRPRPRAIRPTTTTRPTTASRRTPAAPTVAAALLMAGAVVICAPGARAAVADTTPTESIDKLRSTVTRLAAVDSVAPAGWKAMAEQTLALGQELLQAKQPLEPGLVHDALAAVDHGEASDPRAADWNKLREDLRRLLEPPPQEQKQNDQKQDDPQKQQDKKDQQQQSGQQGQPKDDKSQNEKQDQKQDQQQQSPQQQQAQKQDSALGELQKPQDQPPPPKPQAANPQQPQTRKFGGKQDAEQKQSSDDPELAAALARLDQVQENDSPARLHQRIEEEARRQERQGPAPANPHDW
jgi:Ca-activated chloride channel family protein